MTSVTAYCRGVKRASRPSARPGRQRRLLGYIAVTVLLDRLLHHPPRCARSPRPQALSPTRRFHAAFLTARAARAPASPMAAIGNCVTPGPCRTNKNARLCRAFLFVLLPAATYSPTLVSHAARCSPCAASRRSRRLRRRWYYEGNCVAEGRC